MEFAEKLLLAFIPLFVAMDPIGLIPLFLGLTQDVDAERRRRIARVATWTAGIVAVGFMLLGRLIFRALGITVADFQVAGGLVLLALAAHDLLGRSEKRLEPLQDDFGAVPLGLPMIAGPGALTTLLILEDSVGPAYALIGLLLNLLLVVVAFRYGERIAQAVGLTGLRATTKIVALLLMAIAVHMIRLGWKMM
jgi:multiple antibiotic resistance protein